MGVETRSRYASWGRYPKVAHAGVVPISWRSHLPDLAAGSGPVLPYGRGRSYGDCCLNEGGILLDTAGLSRFIAFDRERGILRCEAGVTLGDILDLTMPHGWGLAVVPGTQHVSVGGAIANDVHGKNHHRAGTFGCHVRQFELLRSNNERILCSPTHEPGLFRATIGGLGLTGLILWAELQLKAVPGPWIQVERVRFANLEEFFELSDRSDKDWEHTVSWVDCLAGRRAGRGVFMRGHPAVGNAGGAAPAGPVTIEVPFPLPAFVLSGATMRAFNAAYYHWRPQRTTRLVHYKRFFFPLDSLQNWNRLYGRRGFLQYQCVVPRPNSRAVIQEILRRVSASRQASFLGVMKIFGETPSPGLLSFPRPGVTLTLDFPYGGAGTLRLLEELDAMVRACRGAVYPAKDACMAPESFQAYYPQWKEFARFVDPKFSSSFWRRVTGQDFGPPG
jgi:FAD/FMN-containing dehydrogenase